VAHYCVAVLRADIDGAAHRAAALAVVQARQQPHEPVEIACCPRAKVHQQCSLCHAGNDTIV
jgi:hypothetical protein